MSIQQFGITRRRFVIAGSAIVGATLASVGGYRLLRDHTDLLVDDLYPFVRPFARIGAPEFTAFLAHLSAAHQKLVLGALKKENEPFDVTDIKRTVRLVATNVLTYPFREKEDYNYHEEIVQWVATEFDVDSAVVSTAPTFVLERKVLNALFIKIWDKLTPERVDPHGDSVDKAALALAGGATALITLSATVLFSGLTFYSTMSTVIFSSAGFFGLTLPFGAYVGSSTTVSVLVGPIGWVIAGLAALTSVALFGKANVQKTAAFVAQAHLIKVHSLKNSHRLERVLKELKL
jgi:uncharacterized protein YaaW (UPF0174 family)